MTGFVDLGDVNNHLAAFERSLEEDGTSAQTLAKSMLVLMVRGLFSGLQFPYAQFPCCSLKWHPLMIKWCLHIRHISSGGYRALRKSGCLSLPSQRTLRDYTHYATVTSGFSMAVDQQLIDAAHIGTCEERKKCVVLLLDEMHIKEDLVYNNFSGMLLWVTP